MSNHKPPTNLEIADLLRNVAASYQIKDAKKYFFQINAYERAAEAVEHATSELKDLWDEGKLKDIPGIGKSIANHLDELFKSGKVKQFAELMSGLPPLFFRLIKLPGIGPKTALKMIKEEGISEKVLSDLKKFEETPRRHLLPYAETIAEKLISWLQREKKAQRIDVLGSLRRKMPTVGDIDIAASTTHPKAILECFVKYPESQRVIEKGEQTASILLPGDIQVDLMVQFPQSYGALLQHFTGSKHHNIALREYALKLGYSLSEYGIKKLGDKKGEIKEFADEKDFYRFLNLDYIPPELREDAGEIEAALKGTLPELVENKDVKGDLQIHSDFNIETSHDNGLSTMEEIILKADLLGYEYLAFTEHNPSRSKHSDNEILDLLKKKKEKVDKLNYSFVKNKCKSVKKVFNSLEIDILPNGNCPLPLESFDFLDFALVSVHSSFTQDKDLTTRRILLALEWHPKVKILAHPSARKIDERESIAVSWPEIFAFCVKNNKFLEINADPRRLDLPDFLVKDALNSKVKFSLGTDAHNKEMLENMKYGINVARRGWAQKNDIINCLSLKEFEEVIKK